MISDRDIEFHTPANPSHSWAETGYFFFYIPEQNILAWIYYVHRAGVGATEYHVEIIDRWSDSFQDCLFSDVTNYNPIPVKASRFSLPGGLSYEALSLSAYHLKYDSSGVQIDVRMNALMPPYDIHDPEMDPMAATDAATAIQNSGFGSAYASHFDMSVHATGTLTINGVDYPIDCISTMDHSWGERWENDYHPMAWINAHFSKDYVIHSIFHFDQNAKIGEQHTFRHGYALVNGRVRGLKGGSVRTIRNGIWPIYSEIEFIDVDDRKHLIRGPMVCNHPWQLYGNCASALAMAKWWSPDLSEPGYGIYFDAWPTNHVRV